MVKTVDLVQIPSPAQEWLRFVTCMFFSSYSLLVKNILQAHCNYLKNIYAKTLQMLKTFLQAPGMQSSQTRSETLD